MSDPPDTTVEIRIPSDPEYVKIVRLAVAGIGARLDYSYDDIEDLKLAVTEACNNAILHAQEARGVGVKCSQTGESLEIEITDAGLGFAGAPEGDAAPEELPENGLGLFLMQALMDEVTCESGDGGGTRVRLRKRLPRCP